MTVSPARRAFILELSAAVSEPQAIDCARRARVAGVEDRLIVDDLIAWAQMRAEEIKYVVTGS